ncbi:pilus assembly FimT family protein [Anaerococcus prevotii]|uniref:Prepilin-type cleavage/methylation N-terminal domain protein n=1 Tax=Anaerococcus prevotii ACS-065-V-Col13 TaxID=879305 RepID=F0GWK5_9FIRM|nr:type II secretion system protein [Anaerococcus prevotii]EGC81784.1 prepilin-type cleavage/methylation N-terminal domain protein [Anaerococcus prevotii ACS-065-V-Col13]
MNIKKRGFTLIELLVTVAIISIISTVAVLRLNIIREIKIKNEVNTLANNVYFAKEKAMASGNSVIFKINKDYYTISQKSGLKVEEMEARRVNLNYLRKYGHGTEKFEFLPTGSVNGADSIRFSCDNGYNYILTVGVAGGYSHVSKEKIE